MAKLVFAKILKNKNYTEKIAQIIDYFSHTIKKKKLSKFLHFCLSTIPARCILFLNKDSQNFKVAHSLLKKHLPPKTALLEEEPLDRHLQVTCRSPTLNYNHTGYTCAYTSIYRYLVSTLIYHVIIMYCNLLPPGLRFNTIYHKMPVR